MFPSAMLNACQGVLVEAIESAFLDENDPRAVLQVVGDHPGTAGGTEDAIEPLARTCFGVRTVGEALVMSAEHVKSVSGTATNVAISPPDARLQSVQWQFAIKVGSVSKPYVT